jgi:hypothetical protein
MAKSVGADVVELLGVLSPFSATFALPLDVSSGDNPAAAAVAGELWLFFGYVGWSILYNSGLILLMTRLFQVRWRVAD